MKTAVDTNILLDIHDGLAEELERAVTVLEMCAAQGPTVISTIVYAEASVRFASQSSLDEFLADLRISVEETTQKAAFLAGKSFAAYRKSGGQRNRILADFLIAGHAQVQTGRLLTRDRGFFRKYFEKLVIVEPSVRN